MVPRLAAGTFSGEVTRQRARGSVILSEVLHAAGKEVPDHAHDAPHVCFVLRGAYLERRSGAGGHHGPASLAFVRPADVHGERFATDPTRCFTVELRSGPWARRLARLGADDLAGEENRALAVGPLMQLYAWVRGRGGAATDVDALIRRLVRPLEIAAERRVAIRRPAWLEEVRHILRVRHREGLSLEGLAAVAGVHPVTVSRVFKRCLGATVTGAVLGYRVMDAAERLLGGTERISAVAHGAGFADHGHLCRSFKRVTGMTPSGFRAAAG